MIQEDLTEARRPRSSPIPDHRSTVGYLEWVYFAHKARMVEMNTRHGVHELQGFALQEWMLFVIGTPAFILQLPISSSGLILNAYRIVQAQA